MPSYGQLDQEQFIQQAAAFNLETGPAESFASHTMDFHWNMTNTYHNGDASFSFAEPSSTDMEAPIKYEMARTASNGSMQPQAHEYPPALYQSESNRSATSSAVSSPYSGNTHMAAMLESYHYTPSAFVPTTIISEDATFADYDISEEYRLTGVDPNLLDAHEYLSTNMHAYPQYSHRSYAGSYSSPSPVPSNVSYDAFHQPTATETYFQARSQRGTSVLSQVSGPASPRTSLSGNEDNGQKGHCPLPECGRPVKDLKAHMLTHQSERPEKCPFVNCEYHIKGFSRKYDRNRHVLVHYKGSMVCGFCPGSGSSEERLFSRADVFKRHLTKVHNVDKAAPNSKRRNPSNSTQKLSSYCPDATGKCSTCAVIFSNAQDFYNHLDDCLFRVMEQRSDSERINEMRLAEVESDPNVRETLARNGVEDDDGAAPQLLVDEERDDEDKDEDDGDNEDSNERCGKGMFKSAKPSSNRAVLGGKIYKSRPGKKGMTWSKGGVPLVCKGRKRRKHYPPSWGMSPDKMKMKKRVICAYDGSRRLLKDDIMLHNDHEVRMTLEDESRWITDLDIESINRANAFHNATAEEKGTEEEVWMQEQEFSY